MVTVSYARKMLAGDPTALTEKDLQSLVLDVARVAGYRHYHTHDSRRSPHGFPDLVLVGRGRIMFVELKSEAGKLSDQQQRWIEDLQAAGAEVYVWRPRDWPTIVRTLTGKVAIA